ncbi:MAG TPA: hypothetical protein VJN96_19690 [Vicinamibacterales bacterium]|nr:hypothetical protein [Vicinamibacterales bacterium]
MASAADAAVEDLAKGKDGLIRSRWFGETGLDRLSKMVTDWSTAMGPKLEISGMAHSSVRIDEPSRPFQFTVLVMWRLNPGTKAKKSKRRK